MSDLERGNIQVLGDGLLDLLGIDDPSPNQVLASGAIAEAIFIFKKIHTKQPRNGR